MRNLVILVLALAACGGGNKPAPATPDNTESTEPTGDPMPDDDARTEAECGPVLDHIESVAVEAIDRPGMMAGCQNEWTDAQFDCLGAAADAAALEECW